MIKFIKKLKKIFFESLVEGGFLCIPLDELILVILPDSFLTKHSQIFKRFPDATFITVSSTSDFIAEARRLNVKFDYIFIVDLSSDDPGTYSYLYELYNISNPDARYVFGSFGTCWMWLRVFLGKFGFSNLKNKLFSTNLIYFSRLLGLELVVERYGMSSPIKIPFIGNRLKNIIKYVLPHSFLSTNKYYIFKRIAPKRTGKVSIIIPARNEVDNIDRLYRSIPEIGDGTEIVFVEGGSTDGTYEKILSVIEGGTRSNVRVLRQVGHGKKGAVITGCKSATCDLLIIYDADSTVPEKSLYEFYNIWSNGYGDFLNGTRMTYKMDKSAMRTINYFGNRFLAFVFSLILGQRITDTACGTKMFDKHFFDKLISKCNEVKSDEYGDWTLLLGAGNLNLKILDVPVPYLARQNGLSKMNTLDTSLKLISILKDQIKWNGWCKE